MFGYQILGFGSGGAGSPFIEATGGTVSDSGDFRIHTFTGPGTFSVTNAGSPDFGYVDYLVVAGGGGAIASGGAGAGGFRVSNQWSLPSPTMSPLAAPSGLTLAAGDYSITVGSGGSPDGGGTPSSAGANSVFSNITSAGGAPGVSHTGSFPAPQTGGSGGGGSGSGETNTTYPGSAGNQPPTTPNQGNDGGGGQNTPNGAYGNGRHGGGGGGAGAAGETGNQSANGNGGVGSYVDVAWGPSIGETGPVTPARYLAGGGGGGYDTRGGSTGGTGGAGGGGTGGQTPQQDANAVVANSGGGGGAGTGGNVNTNGTAGGSGIVVIRYRFQES